MEISTIWHTDGSSNDLHRIAGIGGIVRNGNGEMNIRNITLEMDSLLIVNMLKGIFKHAWEIADDIMETQSIIKHLQIEVVHCFREGNTVADALAKFGGTMQD
ncbi:uncharacterized protein LOC142175925 [Nicotiana tabacum]|uniref:Uncharacterized protein LOC142175925 n=1 Tax=Nicotiana tabacum TaxID=4097 RepID=A0AC58TP83_TOBAC